MHSLKYTFFFFHVKFSSRQFAKMHSSTFYKTFSEQLPCKKCDADFLLSFWWQFGRKWDQIRWKSHQFFGKCPGNSMIWTCPKSMSCFSMENKWNLDELHGIAMEFGVSLDQPTSSICDMKWHGCPEESMSHFWQVF